MREKPAYPLKVFYDGSCSVCSTEMETYMRKDHGGRLAFVDIAAPDFDPEPCGIPLADFMYQLHAIDRAGRVYRGVEAFRAIWTAFPASLPFRFMAGLAAAPGVSLVARAAYRIFARVRKYLPKRRGTACSMGKRPPSTS